MTNRELLETIYVCKNEVRDWDAKVLELIDSDIDLLDYCKRFKSIANIKCDYTDIINNTKFVLFGRKEDQSMTDYLSRYLKFIGDFKLVYEKHFSDIAFLDSRVRHGEAGLTEDFKFIRIIFVYDSEVCIKGKKCEIKTHEFNNYAKFDFDGKKTDIGAIFLKNKKFEFTKVKNYKDEVKVLKQILIDESYDLVLLPLWGRIKFNLEDIDIDLSDNKLLLRCGELINTCDLFGDEIKVNDIKSIYNHIKKSDISMIDYYKVMPQFIGMNIRIRLFDIIINMMESLKEDKKKEQLKNHLLQVLKFRENDGFVLEPELLLIIDNIYSVNNASIEENLLILKNGNINFVDLLTKTYGDCDILHSNEKVHYIGTSLELRDNYDFECSLNNIDLVILYDLNKKAHLFKSTDKKLWEILRSQKFLFVQGFYGTLYLYEEGWTDDTSKMTELLGKDIEFWEKAREDVMKRL